MDYTILKKAGVGQKEFADLIDASRVTVNNWVTGKNKPSKHLQKKVKNQLTLVTAAHRLRLLPGEIPTMHKSNVAARKKYIHDKLGDAAKKLRAKKRAQATQSK